MRVITMNYTPMSGQLKGLEMRILTPFVVLMSFLSTVVVEWASNERHVDTTTPINT
jgi:hypothetical protein